MRLVYFGTAVFATAPLKALLANRADFGVVAVVTQPDKRAGRAGEVVSSPVAKVAREAGVKLLQPDRLRDPDTIAELAACKADVFVVASYGKIIPKVLLELPRLGCVNLHGSLLPAYRGSTPIQAAIAAGETTTGVTLMIMDEEVDHGAILAKVETPITITDTHDTLEASLGEAAADLLISMLPEYVAARLVAKDQDHSHATFTQLTGRDDGFVRWADLTATQVERLRRAYTAWPGIFTVWNRAGKPLRIKLLDIEVGGAPAGTAPGTAFVDPACGLPAIAAAEGAVLLRTVQPEGKKPMDGKAFLNGYKDFAGAKMTSTPIAPNA